MTPRAVGVRASYSDVPDAVRVWVDGVLGASVTGYTDCVGGMSPGCAARVVTASGHRAFVKAVGSNLNPDTPTLFRREAAVLALLGDSPHWAPLRHVLDRDGWVALVLDDVAGTHPDLTEESTMADVLVATERLGPLLAERVPDPAAVADACGVGSFGDVTARWAASFDELASVPTDLVPVWVRERSDELRARVSALAGGGEQQLLHWDIRNDNMIQRPDGSIVFVDWGQALLGPTWLDPLLARLERVDDPWFDASLAGSEALARAGDDAVTDWLVGFGTALGVRAHTAVDVNLPTLNALRISESRRALGAAARRLGIDA